MTASRNPLIVRKGYAANRFKFEDYDANLAACMRWCGRWDPGDTYVANQVAAQDAWTMIANKTTTDPPAPQEVGLAEYKLPDAPSWSAQSNVSEVLTAIQITNIIGLYLATKMRVWIPNISASVTYRVVAQNLVTGDVEAGDPFAGDSVGSTGWLETSFPGDSFLSTGDEIRLILSAINSSATTSFNGPWDYSSSNQAAVPATGEVFERNNRTYIRFDKTDDLGAPRGAELATVIAGTVITADTQTWDVIFESDGGTYIEYEIVRSGIPPAVGVHTFTFVIPTAAATDYVELAGYWTANPLDSATVQGVRQFGNDAPVIDDTAYGIDVEVQEMAASPDWELVAYSRL